MARTKRKKNTYFRGRFISVNTLLIIGLCVVMWRIVDLTILDRSFLKSQGDARSLRVIDIPAYRGMIKDRNGEPLAVSTPVQAVWANPQEFDLQSPQLAKLATLLQTTRYRIVSKIKKNQQREFVYLQRGLNPHQAQKIKALNIPGINLQKEFRRFYPEGEVLAHVLGFTNIDDNGQEGLELYYDEWLRGVPGKKRVLQDRLGHVVADIAKIREPRSGRDITLSLDRRIQFLAYRALKATVKQHKARSGSLVVLDAKNGEVLAMVNQPSFNPNQRVRTHSSRYRNRAVTDLFEPGSVVKAFSVASALDSGKYSPRSEIQTAPGWMMVAGNTVKDIRNLGKISVTDVLSHSSNVGVTKMILSSPPEQLWGMLHRVGFGQRTGIGYPGEAVGSLVQHRVWNPFVLATLGFGYGISVTTLQLAHAYSVFANDGKLIPITLLRGQHEGDIKTAMKAAIAQEMLTMLTKVVESKAGSGRRAQIKGYTVAGKTGTARIAGPHGYEKNHHLATFVGVAPASSPRLVIAIVVDDPQAGQYYGGLVAAPLFGKVMAGALRILDVRPDKTMGS